MIGYREGRGAEVAGHTYCDGAGTCRGFRNGNISTEVRCQFDERREGRTTNRALRQWPSMWWSMVALGKGLLGEEGVGCLEILRDLFANRLVGFIAANWINGSCPIAMCHAVDAGW